MGKQESLQQFNHLKSLRVSSKLAEKYQAPPDLMKMITGMRASGAGVVVCKCSTYARAYHKSLTWKVSCSDPRLNPYSLLGIDPNLSKYLSRPMSMR
jgi:carbonic anhydrase